MKLSEDFFMYEILHHNFYNSIKKNHNYIEKHLFNPFHLYSIIHILSKERKKEVKMSDINCKRDIYTTEYKNKDYLTNHKTLIISCEVGLAHLELFYKKLHKLGHRSHLCWILQELLQ